MHTGQVEFAGSLYTSLNRAANAWAETALPDVKVIGPEEDPEVAARELEAFWWTEAQKTGDGPEIAITSEDEWRNACRAALQARIALSRGER